MIKLIITDLDGTLLDDKHKLNEEFWKMEEEVTNRGIVFAVASGRQFFNLEHTFERLKNRMLFFAENGTHVVYKGEELHVDPLKKEAAHELISTGRELKDLQIVLCGKKSAYVESKNEKFINEIKKYYKKLEYVEDLKTVNDTFLKVTFLDWNGVEDNSYQTFKKYSDKYRVAIAAEIFLDITSLTANKGNAIKKVQQRLNISPEETLVFGDFLNDLEMIKNTKNSYAMKNAHPEIIEAATKKTRYSNNENGVIRTLQEIGIYKSDDQKGNIS